jgi:hypothetical protein
MYRLCAAVLPSMPPSSLPEVWCREVNTGQIAGKG